MNNQKVSKGVKTAIVNRLEKIIKKYGTVPTRYVVNFYFKNMKERQKTQQKISELERQLAQLKKKK